MGGKDDEEESISRCLAPIRRRMPSRNIDPDDENMASFFDNKFEARVDEAEFIKFMNSDNPEDDDIRASLINYPADVKQLFGSGTRFRQSHPGVGLAPLGVYGNTITGYINIAPKASKPFSISKNAQIVMNLFFNFLFDYEMIYFVLFFVDLLGIEGCRGRKIYKI